MARVLPSRRIAEARAFERQMTYRRIIATIALVVLLQISLAGLLPLELGPQSLTGTGGDTLRQVCILAVLGLQVLAPASARPPMAMPTSLVVLLGYCLLTCAWAIEPAIGLRRLALTAAVIWMLVRAIGDLGAVRTQNVVRVYLVGLLIANYLTVAFSPLGKHMAGDLASLVGQWRGLTAHKNVAGPACCFTILLFAFDAHRTAPWVRTLIIAASGYFLLMTGAKTSIPMLFIALLAGGVMHFYSPRHRSLVVPLSVIGGTLVFLYLLMYSGVIEKVLDDPNALSGRGAIWPPLLDYAREHLWTGAGFGSFWQIGDRSPIYFLAWTWVATTIGHGHNGYLDLLVTIGLPGLVLAIAVLLVWPAVRLMCSLNIARARRAQLSALMVFCAGSNLTESTILERTSAVQVFLMMAVILIHRLSDQSAGMHQNLRERLVQLATRQGLARARRRLSAGNWKPRNALGWRRPGRASAAILSEDGPA
jgi:O-antigen ligase